MKLMMIQGGGWLYIDIFEKQDLLIHDLKEGGGDGWHPNGPALDNVLRE